MERYNYIEHLKEDINNFIEENKNLSFDELYDMFKELLDSKVSYSEQDKEDIKDGYVFAYVYNKDCEWCSEFGSIAVRPSFGGLVRLS